METNAETNFIDPGLETSSEDDEVFSERIDGGGTFPMGTENMLKLEAENSAITSPENISPPENRTDFEFVKEAAEKQFGTGLETKFDLTASGFLDMEKGEWYHSTDKSEKENVRELIRKTGDKNLESEFETRLSELLASGISISEVPVAGKEEVEIVVHVLSGNEILSASFTKQKLEEEAPSQLFKVVEEFSLENFGTDEAAEEITEAKLNLPVVTIDLTPLFETKHEETAQHNFIFQHSAESTNTNFVFSETRKIVAQPEQRTRLQEPQARQEQSLKNFETATIQTEAVAERNVFDNNFILTENRMPQKIEKTNLNLFAAKLIKGAPLPEREKLNFENGTTLPSTSREETSEQGAVPTKEGEEKETAYPPLLNEKPDQKTLAVLKLPKTPSLKLQPESAKFYPAALNFEKLPVILNTENFNDGKNFSQDTSLPRQQNTKSPRPKSVGHDVDLQKNNSQPKHEPVHPLLPKSTRNQNSVKVETEQKETLSNKAAEETRSVFDEPMALPVPDKDFPSAKTERATERATEPSKLLLNLLPAQRKTPFEHLAHTNTPVPEDVPLPALQKIAKTFAAQESNMLQQAPEKLSRTPLILKSYPTTAPQTKIKIQASASSAGKAPVARHTVGQETRARHFIASIKDARKDNPISSTTKLRSSSHETITRQQDQRPAKSEPYKTEAKKAGYYSESFTSQRDKLKLFPGRTVRFGLRDKPLIPGLRSPNRKNEKEMAAKPFSLFKPFEALSDNQLGNQTGIPAEEVIQLTP